MNVTTATVDEAFAAMLRTHTGRPVGLGEQPKDERLPVAVVHVLPGPAAYGSLGNPLDMMDVVYQVTCVGRTYMNATHMADRVFAACAEHWQDITYCCGVPVVARGATVRVQDDLYNQMVTVTVKASAT